MVKHGGDIYKFPEEIRARILDYSSNINPLDINGYIREIILNNLDTMNRYPDVEYLELRKSIGEFNGIEYDRVVVGNGAIEVLFLYCRSVGVKRATIICPTFGEYERALVNSCVEIDYSYLRVDRKFEIDIDYILENDIFDDTGLVVLCNPNNPTGTFISLEGIGVLNRALKLRGIKLFIDECFIDFVGGWQGKSAVNLEDDNIFVLRAFTKYFGIPGLRLGYGISFDRLIMEKILEGREPWSINNFAEVVGRGVLNNYKFMRETDRWIGEERKWFYGELLEIEDIFVYEPEVNFVLIRLLGMGAREFRVKMLERDILVRDASNFEGLDGHYIRIAIKERKNNIKVLKAIKEVVGCQEF